MAAATPLFTLKLPDAAQPGHYRLLGMQGQEALGRLFEYRLRFCSDKPAIEARKLLGQTLALSMETASGKRWFHGYATGFEYMGPIELPPAQHMDKLPLYEYAVVLRPWLWFLTRSADCRVFQNLKVPEIVATILDKYPGRFEQDDRFPGGLRNATKGSRCRRRPDVGVGMDGEAGHPRLVAEDRSAGPRRRRVDREDRHPVALLDEVHAERLDDGRLPHPRHAGDADVHGPPGIGHQLHQQLLGVFPVVGPGGLHERDRPRQRGPVPAANG